MKVEGYVRNISVRSVIFASALLSWGCSSGQSDGTGAGGSTGVAGSTGAAGSGPAGSGGSSTSGNGGTSAGSAGSGPGGSSAGTAGSPGLGGSTGTAGSGPAGSSGTAGSGPGGSAGGHAGSAPVAGSGGSPSGGSGGSGSMTAANVLVTSSNNNFWKTATWTETTSGTATVTVNDTSTQQKWEGFGGAFNELGWKYLSSAAMQTQAVNYLFSATDGAHLSWGRIPIGASDYAESRFTLEDTTGADPAPNSGETNRPAADTALASFSLTRDEQKLIPYIKAAQGVNPDLRFWASPWTPPVWMKTGYKKNSGADSSQNAKKPSYYDGGNMKSDAATLTAYAEYYKKFVQGYKDKGISIEIVSPQNEPGYDQNYPSCLWDATTYKTFIGTYLGPAMMPLGVKIMLGSLSNDQTDFSIAMSAASDSKAKPFLAVIGAQWNTLDKTRLDGLNSGLPVWASEHKCGNYPWNPSSGCGDSSDSCPAYNSSKAPNDFAYGVESWKYIRNAIKTVKVTSYNAWNMVLDSGGLGIDTSRDWKQNALLVASGGSVTPTPFYWVFRHLSQYVNGGKASVVATTGGDAVAFKNDDGSIVVVAYNSGGANSNFIVQIGSKKLQFAMPASGWATLKYTP
jgi:glucosylceramidase